MLTIVSCYWDPREREFRQQMGIVVGYVRGMQLECPRKE